MAAYANYLDECRRRGGIRDLYGLPVDAIHAFLALEYFQRRAQATGTIMDPLRIYQRAQRCVEKRGCVSCWLQERCCICARAPPFQSCHRIVVFMHHAEFTRASNTGKLLVRTRENKRRACDDQDAAHAHGQAERTDGDVDLLTFSNNNTRLFLSGIPRHEHALIDLCNRDHSGRTVVLFPSKSAITVQQLKDELDQRREPARADDSQDDPSSSSSSSSQLTIIVLDGTWRQARHLRRMLPSHIRCVRIDARMHSLLASSALPSTLMRPSAEDMKSMSAEELHNMGKRLFADDMTVRSVLPSATASGSSASTSTSSACTASFSIEADSEPALMFDSDDEEDDAMDDADDVDDESDRERGQRTKRQKQQQQLQQRDDDVATLGNRAPSAAKSNFNSLFHPLRRQTQQDRCSTVEALFMMLKELGEPSSVTQPILDGLMLLVDAVRVQGDMTPVYGSFSDEEMVRMRVKQPSIRFDQRPRRPKQQPRTRNTSGGPGSDPRVCWKYNIDKCSQPASCPLMHVCERCLACEVAGTAQKLADELQRLHQQSTSSNHQDATLDVASSSSPQLLQRFCHPAIHCTQHSSQEVSTTTTSAVG